MTRKNAETEREMKMIVVLVVVSSLLFSINFIYCIVLCVLVGAAMPAEPPQFRRGA